MTDDALDIIETDRLIAALERRCEGILVGMVQEGNDGGFTYQVYHSRNLMVAIGLADYCSRWVDECMEMLRNPIMPDEDHDADED
jgi:hypothetical protein